MSDKVQAALEARKKRLESTRSFDRVAAALEARKKRLESTRNDQTSVTSDLQKRYSSVVDSFNSATKNYSRSYGEKALSDTLDKYRADTIRVSDLRKDLELNRKNIGNDKAVDEMLSTLNSISDGYRSIFEDAKIGSQFKDEDEFQTAVRESKYFENHRNKDYSEILADIVSLPEGEEKEWLSAHQYDILRFNDDFSEYSDMGSSAVNPSWEEAATPFSLFGWKPMDEGADIGNIVTFAEQNKEKAVADAMAAANGGGYDSEHTELVNLINVHMKDDEKAIYNYLIGKGEYDRANEYITQLSDVLRQRAAGLIVDQIEGSSMGMPLELMLSAVAGLENFGTGIKNLGAFVTGAEGAPTSATQYAHSFASEDNSGAWKVVNDLAYTTGNMAPSILVGSVTLGAGGAITMGASSAGNAYSEMRKRGYNEWQSRGYGTLVGASEAGLSYLLGGIGKLGGKLSGKAVSKLVSHFDNAIARTAISLGGNMISEGVEEAVQTVLEPAFKALVTGEEFDSPEWSEVFYSALLGALSAGVVEGVPTIAGEAASNYRAKRDYGDVQSELVAEGLESAEGSLSNNLAQKYKKKLDSRKDLSGSQLKKLVEANEQQFAAEDVAAIQTAAENRLSSLGETGNVKAISAALAKQASGEKLTRAEKKILKESKFGQRVSDELNPENIKSGKHTTAWTQNIGTNRINTKEYNSAETKEKVKYSSAASVGTVKDAIKLGDVAVSDKGEARVLSTGENVTIDKNDPIVRIDNVDGENVVVYNTTAGEVASSDIEYDNEDTAVVYEALARFGTSNKAIDIKTLNQFISGFVPGKGLSSSEYVSAIEDAYRYGVLGYSVNELASDKAISLLPSEQRKAAYKLGKQVGFNDASARQKTLSEVKKTGNKKKGKLFFDGRVSGRNLTEIQRASLKALGTVSDSLGIDIHIFESETDESGRRTGANGWYDPKDNSIHIDLYSGVDGKGMMLFTAAHELTHLIRKNAPEKFKAFADFLFEEYNKSGKSVEELIQTKRAFLEAKGRITSDMTEEQAYDLAYEEVVADSCEAMLVDSNAIETISKLKAQDKGLWQTIKDFIDRLVRRIRAAYKGLNPDSAEANYVRDMVDAAEKLQKLWVEGLTEASKATSNIVEIDADTKSVSPMLSERTWSASEYVTERAETAKKISEALGVSLKTAYKYIDDINGVARLIADDRTRLDYEPNLDENATVLKPNSDYGYSIDMSTLCAKRLLFTGTFDAIQKVFPNRVFSSEDIVKIREMMQDRGYQVACGICYVESTRREIGRITQDFINSYVESQKTGNPMTRINSEGKVVELKKTKEQKKTTVDKSTDKFFADKNYTPTLADLNTTDIDLVKRDHPLVYEAYLNFMNARGQAKPKLLETRAEYKGEILKHFKNKNTVAGKNAEGGLRLQSFSDFEVVHMIDMMQIVMDMSRVGLMSQAYTKVPAFAEVFGDTGVKINLSLIAKGDGLDSNGNLIFDDVEGIDHKEAFKLRDKYSKNVGTVLVGKNDAHIIAAMADPRIDYIIPFHKSSWKESLYDALGLTGYEDYTDTQHERYIDKSRGKAKDFAPSEYWDYTKSGDENAQIYLEKCREDGRIPKFPQFQGYPGYWKLLIDFKMYDNDGVGSPQEVVKPTFNTEASEKILREYEGGHRSFPVAKDVVEDFVKEHKEKVKYSDRDFSYMDAVNRGDMETAQRMVDKAARDAGYTNLFYHGAKKGGGFTEFRDWSYFTENKEYAKRYTDRNAPGSLYTTYVKLDNPFDTRKPADRKLFDSIRNEYGLSEVQDTGLPDWTDGYDIADYIDENELDYDGIILDEGGDLVDGKPVSRGLSYVIRKSAQIKSADPVTYDDNGNVIPLSERFNTENNDIRYSDRAFSQDFTENTLNGFGIKDIKDYIHVQRRVFDTLLEEGFFTDTEKRSRTDVNAESGMLIETNKSSISETFNADNYKVLGRFKKVAKLATVRMLPEVIKNGTLISDNVPNQHQNSTNKTFAYIAYDTAVEGIPVVIKLDIKKSPIKNKLWVHSIVTEKNSTGQGVYSKNGTVTPYRTDAIDDSIPQHYNSVNEKFSDRPTDSFSNRSLLANALESTANSEAERELLAKYKDQIDEYNAEEQKLHDLRRQIKDLSFAKGARDTKRLKELQLEAKKSANRINIYDKRLLKLESAKNLKDVLEREKKRAYDRATRKGKEALAKYKEEAKQRIDSIIAENREKRTESIIRRKSSELRTKIKKFKESLERSLQRPTDNVYVPAGLVQSIIDVCSLIDTDTDLYKADGSLNKAQEKRNLTKEKLLALSDEYKKLRKDKDDPISSEFDEAISEYLDDIRQKFSGKSLADMEYEELVMFFDILKSINETLRDARKLIGRTDAQTIYEAADSIIAEQSKITKKRKNGKRNVAQRAKDNVIDLSLSPVRNVERMSGYNQDSELVKLFNDFEKGVRQKNFFAMNAYKAFEDLTTGQNSRVYDDAIYEEYGNRKYTDDNGRKFGISKMQMMQTILSYEREVANNMHHIEGDGITFADMKMLRKGKLKDAVSEEYSHRIPAATGLVGEFRDALANDQWAQAYMEAARKFFNGTAKDAINETYLTLKHRIIARDKNYIPFEVDKNFVVREISPKDALQQTINSYGMLKETKDGASQPLIITGLNNILDRHIEQVGNVYGLAVPVRNFTKVWNARAVKTDAKDTPATPVQAAIQRNWGHGGTNHIAQTVQDLQGSRPNTQYGWYRKAKSGYIGATFLLNLSVVTKQIGSLYAATSMLKWRGAFRMTTNLIGTMINYKKISAEVDKYTASAWMRRQGLSDAELYTLLTESRKPGLLKFFGKFPTVINPAKWITAMDSTVALSLWKYAKQDTAKRTGLKGEELLRATAEFYDSVVENTQSMTDVLHRPEIQKRSDVVSETFGMFKTDLYQMAGQLQVSLGRFNANKNAENGKALGRTVYAILRSAIWGSLMTSLFALLRYKVNPYRDEDDKDLTVWSWLKRQLFGLGGDVVGYFLPLAGSEIVETFENFMYGESEDIVDSLALTAINDIYDAMITIGSAVKDGEMPSAAQYEKLVVKALQVFGVPANNIKRIVDAITLHVKDIANGQFFSFEAGAERTAANYMHGIVEELYEGNEDEADKRFEKAIAEKSESALKTALGNMYKEGKVDRGTAERMLSEYFGMSDDEIYWRLDEWSHSMVSEEDYNKYDDFESAVTTGKNLGEVIDEYVDNGVSLGTLRSKVKDIYTSGGLITSDARGILTKYFDMTSDDAYWLVDEWDYVKENETRDGYGKYNDFVEAVKTGKNLKKVIADYTAHGVTKQTLASQITKEFKPKYVTMSKKDKAALKGYLLNAYELLGYERTEKAKDIDKWIE